MAATRKPPGQAKEARLVVFGSRLLVSNLFLGEADYVRPSEPEKPQEPLVKRPEPEE